MMKLVVEGLKVVNLGLDGNLELGDVTTVIGTNGSGKTLLSKLFYAIAKSLTRPSPELLYHGTSEVERLVSSHIDEELTHVFNTRPGITGKVSLESEGGRVTVTFDEGRPSVNLTDVGDVISELYSKFFPAVFIPIDRARALDGESGGALFEVAETVKASMTEARIYGEYTVRADGLGMSVVVDRSSLHALINGKASDVHELPYGYMQLIPLILLARSYKYLIIDEPTLNLHPDVQVRLGNYIYDMVMEGKRFLLATHSDIFTVQLAINHVKRGEEKGKTLKIYFLDRGTIEEIKYTEAGDIESIPTITDTIRDQVKEIEKIAKTKNAQKLTQANAK